MTNTGVAETDTVLMPPSKTVSWPLSPDNASDHGPSSIREDSRTETPYNYDSYNFVSYQHNGRDRWRPRYADSNPFQSEDGAREQKKLLEERKRDLIESVANSIRNRLDQMALRQAHEPELREILKLQKSSENMLYWIAMYLLFATAKKRHEIQAGLELAEITLHIQPQLIYTPKDDNGETPLHTAIKHETLEDLAWRLCETFPKEHARCLREAIRTRSATRGETCLHIALMLGRPIAYELIRLASKEDLSIARKILSDSPDGKEGVTDGNSSRISDDGNTPLHEAVCFQRCLCEAQKLTNATKTSLCKECEESTGSFQRRRDKIFYEIKALVEKNKDVLKETNGDDLTPYLYHRKTKAMSEQPVHLEGTQPSEIVVAASLSMSLEIEDVGHSMSRPIQTCSSELYALLQQQQQLQQAQNQQLSSIETVLRKVGLDGANVINTVYKLNGETNGPDITGLELSSPHNETKLATVQTATGHPRRPPEILSPVSQIINNKNEDHPNTTDRDNDQDKAPYPADIPPATKEPEVQKPQLTCYGQAILLAQEVEEFLLESSFNIGEFEEACDCFFGKNPVSQGKEPNFRPGDEIHPSYLEYYEEVVDCTETLAQVDLELASSPPEEASASPERRKTDRARVWGENKDAVEGVFDMLHRKGVRRILKLTVRDNLDDPCSDEVIERCLKRFDVRYLDWQKYDLCAEVILSAAPNVVKLTLHSSGSHAVLRSWASEMTLCELNKLKAVTLDAKTWKNYGDYDRYLKNINDFVQDLVDNVAAQRTKLFLTSEKAKMEAQKEKTKLDQEAINKTLAALHKLDPKEMTPSRVQIDGKVYISKQMAALIETLDKKISHLKAELSDLQKEQEGIKELRRKRRNAPTPGPGSIKPIEKALSTTKDPSRRLPRLFQTPQGYVVADFKIEPPQVDQRPKPDVSDEDASDSAAAEASDNTGKTKHLWVDSVKKFVNRYVEGKEAPCNKRIKVALIDDGVTVNTEALKGRIHRPGWPRQKPKDRAFPWYKSTTNHGTDMARLIRMVCPHVELYVAKIGQWENDNTSIRDKTLGNESTATIAADAINWARDERVDIISMSWNLIETKFNKSEIKRLNAEIQNAANEGIILFCAAADTCIYGATKRLYPQASSTDLIKTVGSADPTGWASQFVYPEKVDYLLPGQDIEDLKSGEGSSAATALAAGFAALILWCFEKENKKNKKGMNAVKDPKEMFKIFDKLMENKFVEVTTLIKDGEQVSPSQVVAECSKWIG